MAFWKLKQGDLDQGECCITESLHMDREKHSVDVEWINFKQYSSFSTASFLDKQLNDLFKVTVMICNRTWSRNQDTQLSALYQVPWAQMLQEATQIIT